MLTPIRPQRARDTMLVAPTANISPNPNIVHESEAQRQFVRVRFPASIQFTAGGERRCYPLNDISAGGFSFDPGSHVYKAGEQHSGEVLVSIDAVGFSIPVSFDIRAVEADKHFIACVFQDLGPKETAALRQIITAFLGGELTSAGDMLATLSRENFVKSRGTRLGGGLSASAKLRALLGTLIALVIGVAAFAYTATHLYEIVFVTHATAAKVAAPVYTIAMPRDGTFFTLVEKDGSVKKGQPLGSFQTALLDVVEGVPGSFKLSPELLTQLVGQQLRGSLASPCDCIVQKMFVTDAQYILRNQSVMQLVQQGTKPYILARFHYDQLKQLRVGREIYFRVNGQQDRVTGTLAELRVLPAQTLDANGLNDLNGLNTNAAITDVIAVIEPATPMSLANIDEPVEVLIDPLFDRYR